MRDGDMLLLLNSVQHYTNSSKTGLTVMKKLTSIMKCMIEPDACLCEKDSRLRKRKRESVRRDVSGNAGMVLGMNLCSKLFTILNGGAQGGLHEKRAENIVAHTDYRNVWMNGVNAVVRTTKRM